MSSPDNGLEQFSVAQFSFGKRNKLIHGRLVIIHIQLSPPHNGTWIKPSVHPCQRPHKDIQDSASDYIDLLNTVERHSYCSSDYCLRRKQNKSELQCRFNFPFKPSVTTKLEFEPVHSKNNKTGAPNEKLR